MKKKEKEYLRIQGLKNLFICLLKFGSGYSMWQENWNNLDLDICEYYYKFGITCIAAGDEKRIMYGLE